MNILLVDDEEVNLKVLEAMLAPQKHGLLKARDGETALRILEEQEADMVLLDVMLPGISGLEVLREIRANEKLKTLPVILITALGDKEDRIQGLSLDADDYVSKPFDHEELLARINGQLKLSYLRRQLVEKEKFETLVHAMSDGAIVCAPDYKITRINASAQRYLGIADPEKVNLLDFLFNHYSVSVGREELRDFSRAHKTFEIMRAETERFKPLYLEAVLDILKNPGGEASCIVLVLRDVTAARREEKFKQEFLSLISHKLRTPASIIQGGLDCLRLVVFESLKDADRDMFMAIEKDARKLAGLIDKLIHFAVLNSTRLDSPEETLLLDEHIRRIAEPFAKAADKKKADIRIDLEDNGLTTRMNRADFGFILRNLLENAVKFNDKEEVRIVISAKKTAGRIRLCVKDNGPGIPPEDQENIFTKFYQVEKYFTGQVEGVGLGLAAVKQMVHNHGGQIRLESVLGQGAEFIMDLPGTGCL